MGGDFVRQDEDRILAATNEIAGHSGVSFGAAVTAISILNTSREPSRVEVFANDRPTVDLGNGTQLVLGDRDPNVRKAFEAGILIGKQLANGK